jgi:hypothetical protein
MAETNALAELNRLEQRLTELRSPRDAKAEIKWADLMPLEPLDLMPLEMPLFYPPPTWDQPPLW